MATTLLWYVSGARITCRVETTTEGIIVSGAPVIGKFIGQKIENLIRWLDKPDDPVEFKILGVRETYEPR